MYILRARPEWNSIPPLPCTIRETCTRSGLETNPSRVWLRHSSRPCHKQGQVPSRWPSCDSRHPLVWDFRYAGSACAREHTSHAYFAWLLRSCFFFRREPLKLEQRCIIIKHPNISFESSFVQYNTLHNLLQLISTRIWMLASLPSMGDRANDCIPLPFSPGLYFLVTHQGCFSLFGVRRNEGLGLEFLATWQWAFGSDQLSEVPEAMHLTLRQVT